MQHGGVMLAAELAADFGKGGGGELLHDEHGHLARQYDLPGIAADIQILGAETEDFADAFLNLLDGDLLFLRLDNIFQDLLGGGKIQFGAGERRVGHQADERAFELANIGFDGAGDVLGYFVGELDAFAFGFFLQNGDFGFEIGQLNIGDQAPFEARAQALFDGGNFLGRAIGRDDDLLLLIVERIESVEKFFLGAFASGDELDVVNHEDVHIAETVAEGGHALEANGGNHFVGKFFGADVGEAHGRVSALERVADGLHQVRLAQSHTAVEEKRIVGLRGLLSDSQGRGVRELVGSADDERIKGVARVQLIGHRVKIQLGLRGGGRSESGRDGSFRFGAHKIQMQLGLADFDQDRFQ